MGPGAKALGFEHGQLVERGPYDLLFGQRKAPDGTPLGKPPGDGRKAQDTYARLLAGEPHATAERRRELRIEAARQARLSPLFFDLTISLSKSISIFHASLGENARLARQASDNEGDRYWSALVGGVDDMIWHAVWAGFAYFQRAPDSLGYNEHVGAVAAIVSQYLEEALTSRFGLEWVARDDGHGFEIEGISGEMMRLFSTRRESITADLRDRAARFEEQYGRAPSQRELAHLPQASNFKTRKAKHGTLDVAQIHAGLAYKLARTLDMSLASVAPSVWHGGGHAGTHAPGPDAPGPLPHAEMARAAQKAVALAQQEKSTWTRADVIKYLGRVLPRSGMDPAAAAAVLEDLADRALRSEFEPVICLAAPEPVQVPASLLRADGPSVYQRHGGVRYATCVQLTMEERMIAQAGASGAPRMYRAGRARARRRPCRTGRDTNRPRGGRERATHSIRAARRPGRCRMVGADRRPARIGDQHARRVREDTRAGRSRADLGRGRAGPGDRHHPLPVRPQHPGRRSPGQLQQRAVPGPPARPARRSLPGPDSPGHAAGH